MANQESTVRTLVVALLVCLVCSVFVAVAAVGLKPIQMENRLLDKQRSILNIAGLLQSGMSNQQVKTLYSERIVAKVVDLKTGEFTDQFDPERFDPLSAAKDPALSESLNTEDDIASIKRRENYATVYLVESDSGSLETVVIPVRGYGLWSTLYGFIALEKDLKTVKGFGFYQHGETPGLGGEVDNPRWLSQWPGKVVFDPNGNSVMEVVKGHVDTQGPNAMYQVDGLAGATLTSNGVTHLLRFWLGEQGFGPFLAKLQAGEA